MMSENQFDSSRAANTFRSVFKGSNLVVRFENFSQGPPEDNEFHVSIDRGDQQCLMELRLSAVADQTKMFISSVDGAAYERIRKEQGLHVSFDGFVAHLMHILECCQKGELLMGMIQENGRDLILQFYEKRSFRNLIHLYLPVAIASIETVLYHINKRLMSQQERVNYQQNQTDGLRHELALKDAESATLRQELKRVKEALAERENMVFAQNLDEMKQLQAALKDVNEAKDQSEMQFRGIVQGLEAKMDTLTREKRVLSDRVAACAKDVDSYMQEGKKLRHQIVCLKEQNEKLLANDESKKMQDKKHELNVLDLKRQLKDAREKTSALEKQRSDLIAELEAEKIVCQTKRNALQIATEEISKANDIIMKQSREMLELKRKSETRAEVALKQEKLLMERDEELAQLQTRKLQLEKELKRYGESTHQLTENVNEIKAFSDQMEDKYKQKILDLEKRLASATCLMPSTSSGLLQSQRALTNGNYQLHHKPLYPHSS